MTVHVTNTPGKAEVISDTALEALRNDPELSEHPFVRQAVTMIETNLPALREAADTLANYSDRVREAEETISTSDSPAAVEYRKVSDQLSDLEAKRAEQESKMLARVQAELDRAFGEPIANAEQAEKAARTAAVEEVVGQVESPETARIAFTMGKTHIETVLRTVKKTADIDLGEILRPNFSAANKSSGRKSSGGPSTWSPRLSRAFIDGEEVAPVERNGKLTVSLGTVAETAGVDRKALAEALEAANGGRNLPVGESVDLSHEGRVYTLVARDTTGEYKGGRKSTDAS